MSKKRNGKIELYRFIMCIGVLLFHLQKYMLGEAALNQGVHAALFPHGAAAVEFFFLLSGFLMAKSIYNRMQREPETQNTFRGSEGLRYVWGKYMGVFPYHLITFFTAYISYGLYKDFGLREWILKLVDSVPAFLLIQMSGASFTSPNHVEWYISAMLIAMLIVYPLVRRFYEPFTRYIAPLTALLILGYLLETGNALSGVMVWTGIAYRGMLRAIAEIMLGVSAFEASRALSRVTFTEQQKTWLTVGEIILMLGILIVFIFTFPKTYEFYALLGSYLLIVLAFSGVTKGDALFNNSFVYFLGKITLPVYLAQVTAINLVLRYGTSLSPNRQVAAGFVLTFVLAAVVMVLGDLLMAKMKKKEKAVRS